MLTFRAPAKLNLQLSVGRRRSDGMHPLVSVMQSIDLYDEVTVAPAEDFTCTVEPAGAAPSDSSNLAVRAARAFAALHFEDDAAVAVSLLKRIPSQAGLGGGSADAAAVLVALNEATGGTVSRKALERIGATLGSDVPFCVRGGTAVVTGTGEQVTSIPCPTPLHWVLGIPAVGCSTAGVYAWFDELGGGADLDLRGAPHEMADALSRGDIGRVAGLVSNDLEEAACALEPSLKAGRDALEAAGATKVVLSGSGSAWAGLCLDGDQAGDVAAKAEASGDFTRVVLARSVPQGPTVLDG
ncbi:MAG: 4-(cytidine 5'-diphospho)-2-C-methyl-D-erythritol kinase [Actinomycetota bacterium]